MFVIPTLVWLALWSTLMLAAGMLRGEKRPSPVLKLVFWPGFLVEAVLRLAGCLLSGTKIERVNLVRPGEVLELGRPPIRHLSPAILVTTRLLLTFTALFVYLAYFPDLIECELHLPIFEPNELRDGDLDVAPLEAFWAQVRTLPDQLQVHRIHGWVFVYLAIGLLTAAGLRRGEYLAALYALVVFHVVAFAGSWIGLEFGFLSRGHLITFFYGEDFWSAFSLLVLLTLAAAGVALVVRLATFVILGRRAQPTE